MKQYELVIAMEGCNTYDEASRKYKEILAALKDHGVSVQDKEYLGVNKIAKSLCYVYRATIIAKAKTIDNINQTITLMNYVFSYAICLHE